MRERSWMVPWTNGQGVDFEAGQRHAEIIVRELGLESDSKRVHTPGIAAKWGDQGEAEELVGATRTWYRGLVA